MADLNVIKEIAEQALAVPTAKGVPDRFLIDRASRIMRHCGGIAQLNEVRRFQIDHFCLNTAVLFRDAGFACYANQEDRTARMVLADLNDADMRDFSTQIVHEKLHGLLNPRQMERICSIINESNNRSTCLIEAMILSDARNLDDMGAVGIFNEMRRYVVHGYGATEALTSWKRKIDYDYWTARLRESFRFEGVRKIAQKRLQIAEQFMAQLEIENRSGDLEDMLLEQQLSTCPAPAAVAGAARRIVALPAESPSKGRPSPAPDKHAHTTRP